MDSYTRSKKRLWFSNDWRTPTNLLMQSHPSSCCSPLELYPLSLLRLPPCFLILLPPPSPPFRLSHARASISSPFRLSFYRLSTEPATIHRRYPTSWTKLLRDCILNKISPGAPRRQPLEIIIVISMSVFAISRLFHPPLAVSTSCSCPSSRSSLRENGDTSSQWTYVRTSCTLATFRKRSCGRWLLAWKTLH